MQESSQPQRFNPKEAPTYISLQQSIIKLYIERRASEPVKEKRVAKDIALHEWIDTYAQKFDDFYRERGKDVLALAPMQVLEEITGKKSQQLH